MFRIWEIVAKNEATYYNYNSGAKRTTFVRRGITIFISLILALVFWRGTENFINGVIATQSILIGFAFNVLFSIGSKPILEDQDVSIESKLRRKKIIKLTNELFHNISYFIMLAITCLALALIILLTFGEANYIHELGSLVVEILSRHTNLSLAALHVIGFITSYIFVFLFYLSLLESLVAFTRAVNRVNFIFEKRGPE